MTNIKSVDPKLDGQQVTLKFLDQSLYDLKLEFATFVEKVSRLESEIKQKDVSINELKIENSDLKKKVESLEAKKDTSTIINDTVWSGLLKSQKQTINEKRFLGLVNQENNAKSRIENNILLTGIKEDPSNLEADNTIVEKVLNALQIDSNTVKRKKRIKRRDPNDKDGKPLKPFELIVVEFIDNSTRTKALLNSKKLKECDELKQIYINRDKTEAERQFDKEQRAERNKLNELLTNEVVENPRLRYSFRKDKSMFYWGIRGGQLTQVSFKLPENTTGKSRANE